MSIGDLVTRLIADGIAPDMAASVIAEAYARGVAHAPAVPAQTPRQARNSRYYESHKDILKAKREARATASDPSDTSRNQTVSDGQGSDLEDAARAGPMDEIEFLVSELVARYATAKMDEVAAALRIEWYVDALHDLPAWSVREAIRRRRRGQCGAQNYDFAPSESVLRKIAEDLVVTARGQHIGLQRLLAAEPVGPVNPDVAEANRRRFAAAMEKVSREIQARSRLSGHHASHEVAPTC